MVQNFAVLQGIQQFVGCSHTRCKIAALSSRHGMHLAVHLQGLLADLCMTAVHCTRQGPTLARATACCTSGSSSCSCRRCCSFCSSTTSIPRAFGGEPPWGVRLLVNRTSSALQRRTGCGLSTAFRYSNGGFGLHRTDQVWVPLRSLRALLVGIAVAPLEHMQRVW